MIISQYITPIGTYSIKLEYDYNFKHWHNMNLINKNKAIIKKIKNGKA